MKSQPFNRGFKLGKQTARIDHAFTAWMHMKYWGRGQMEELSNQFDESMWLSIIPLKKLAANPDADSETRRTADTLLKRLVLHFYENPRDLGLEENFDKTQFLNWFNAEVDKGFNANRSNSETDEVVDAMREAGLDQSMNGMGGFLGELIQQKRFHDQMILAIVQDLIEKRHFPGKPFPHSGFTIIPPESGGTRSGGWKAGFHLENQLVNVFYDGEVLVINGKSYGRMKEGDVIDLRRPGYIYINDGEGSPLNALPVTE